MGLFFSQNQQVDIIYISDRVKNNLWKKMPRVDKKNSQIYRQDENGKTLHYSRFNNHLKRNKTLDCAWKIILIVPPTSTGSYDEKNMEIVHWSTPSKFNVKIKIKPRRDSIYYDYACCY